MRLGIALVGIAGVVSAQQCVDLVRDCGAVADNHTDVAGSFAICQQLAHSSSGNGCVFVPGGAYMISGVLINASNTEIIVDNDVIFSPWHGITKPIQMFTFGPAKGENPVVPHIVNVSMHGTAPGQFMIDVSHGLFSPWKTSSIGFTGWVEHFSLANAFFKLADPNRNPGDRYATEMPGVGFNYAVVDGQRKNPTGGHIANITSTGGIFGYGQIQVRSAEDLLFENLDGTGGVTLRLESGGLELEYINNVTGRNITGRDCHSAFMAEPHTQKNGVFHVQDVYAYDCGVGVEFNAGYEEDGMPPGFFSNDSTAANIEVYYGKPGWAQLNRTVANGTACTACASVSNSPLNYLVTSSNISSFGFPPPSNRSACIMSPIKFDGCPYPTS